MKKLFILLLLAPIAVMAQVPATSAYNTDKAEFFLEDEVNNALSTPDMIMCFMGALRPDLMVGKGATPTSEVTYLALVDEAQCDSESVAQGPQNQSAAAGAASNAKSASISYTEAIVSVSKASVTAPMIVKAWILFKAQEEGENDQVIYTITTVDGAPSDEEPFGDFDLNYSITELGAVIGNGYLRSSEASLQWRDVMSIQGQEMENRAILNFGTGATGNGAIQYLDYQNNSVNIDSYAYTEESFCRQNQSVNGVASGAAEVCYSTDESEGKKEVFGYKLYDSTSGEQFDLTNTGFGIKFTNDSDEVVFGWADYWGIHFEESIANSITNGKVFTKDDSSSVTAAIYNGKLIKRTVEKVTLNSMNGLRFNAYVDINSLGINGNEYK